jgi:hypothetical protein
MRLSNSRLHAPQLHAAQILLLILTFLGAISTHASGAGLSRTSAERPLSTASSQRNFAADSAHGRSGIPVESGPAFLSRSEAGRYKTLYPPPELTRELNIEAFERAKGRSSYGKPGYCAAGVRETLNALFGKNVPNGPNAKDYNEKILAQWRTSNACYKPAYDSGTAFQNFDIRVLKPKNSREYGHIEIFYEGKWYSDFIQDASLWSGSNGKYKAKSLYRLSHCAPRAQFRELIHWIASCLLSSAHAQNMAWASAKPSTRPAKLLAEARDSNNVKWLIKDVAIGEGSKYVLYKVQVNGEVAVLENLNSIYSLIHSIEDKKLQIALAKNSLNKWIDSDGKEEVQKYILNSEAFTDIQREVYVEAGFKLPKDYIIYKPAPSTKP